MSKHTLSILALATASSALADEDTALYHCSNNLTDFGHEVTFFGDPQSSEITRAVLSANSSMGPRTVSELNVCTRIPAPEFRANDGYVHTYTCNDVDWHGHNADLHQGGFSGIPFVVVTRIDAPDQAVLTAHCRTRP